MASSFFKLTITYPGKPPKVRGAQVANGPVTGEWYAAHLQRVNAFPGAEKIDIEETEGKLRKLEDVVKQTPGRTTTAVRAPTKKVTPLGSITKRIGSAPDESQMERISTGHGSVGKAGVSGDNTLQADGGVVEPEFVHDPVTRQLVRKDAKNGTNERISKPPGSGSAPGESGGNRP